MPRYLGLEVFSAPCDWAYWSKLFFGDLKTDRRLKKTPRDSFPLPLVPNDCPPSWRGFLAPKDSAISA
jgi:hypothetical protein